MCKITLFGRAGCEPCGRLKEMLISSNIQFEYIDVTKLSEEEQAHIFWIVNGLTGFTARVVPVVNIKRNRKSIWLASFNELEPTSLFAQINEVIDL